MSTPLTVLEHYFRFVSALRSAGIPVSLTESLDGCRALKACDLASRSQVESALMCTMVKDERHLAAFVTLFSIHFAGLSRADQADFPDLSDDQLQSLVRDFLAGADDVCASELAARVVVRYGGMDAGHLLGANYHAFRTLRRLEDAFRAPAARPTEPDDFRSNRMRTLENAVHDSVRVRLVDRLGPEEAAKGLVRPVLDDVEFLQASPAELDQIRRALPPLARKLSVRLARRRRHRRRGNLDFRRTMRNTLSAGGVPVEPRFRRPHPNKPALVVVADVSGSVASFARFTLQLLYALSAEFSKVRSFVFIDGMDEITPVFDGPVDADDALRRAAQEADIVRSEGHSDYGRALTEFWERWGRDLSPSSTVLFMGDARSNYHPGAAAVVESVARRVKHTYWLNPEPRNHWGTGDSVIYEYAPFCDEIHECRNLRQLSAFIGTLS